MSVWSSTLLTISKHSREENERTMNSQEIETHHGEASASRMLESGHTRDRTVSDTMKKIDDPDVLPGRNAGRSGRPQRRGPKTAAGRARIGLNALTHGISSARLVVPGESTTEWELSRQAIGDALAPASARLLPHPLDIDKIIRYEAHLNRLLYQALHQLEAMRAERHGQPTPLLRVDVQHHTGTPEAADGSSV